MNNSENKENLNENKTQVEVLSDEIGKIKEVFIAESNADRGEHVIRVQRVRPWQYMSLVAAMLVAVIGAGLMLHFFAPEPRDPNATDDPSATDTADPTDPSQGRAIDFTANVYSLYYASGGVDSGSFHNTIDSFAELRDWHDTVWGNVWNSNGINDHIRNNLFFNPKYDEAFFEEKFIFIITVGDARLINHAVEAAVYYEDDDITKIYIDNRTHTPTATHYNLIAIELCKSVLTTVEYVWLDLIETTPSAPTPDVVALGIDQFIEYLEDSGVKWRQFHEWDGNIVDDYNKVIGQIAHFAVADGVSNVSVREYISEELAADFLSVHGYNSHSTTILSGTVVISHFGNDPEVVAFLQRYYDDVIVIGCTCTVCLMEQSTDELEIISLYAQGILGGLTQFNDINDVDLYRLLYFYGVNDLGCGSQGNEVLWTDEPVAGRHNYTTEELEKLLGYEAWLVSGHGITPALLEKQIREQLNPNFTIANYDYKTDDYTDYGEGIHGTKWDANRSMIVQFRYPSCGLPFDSYRIKVEEVRKVGNEYHVYALRWIGYDFIYNAEFVRAVFVKNADGSFRVTSMKADTSLAPEWVIEYTELRGKLEKDPALAYKYLREVLDTDWNTPCSAEYCEIVEPRTICDSCMKWRIPEIMGIMFSSHVN